MIKDNNKLNELLKDMDKVFSLVEEMESIDLNFKNIKELTKKAEILKQKLLKNLDTEK